MLCVTKRILSYLRRGQRYLDLELASPAEMSDDDWTRDPQAEYWTRDPESECSLDENELEAESMVPVMMHPDYRPHSDLAHNRISAELVSMTLHDIWMPLAEFYCSLARIERYMANRVLLGHGYGLVTRRWPWIFTLLMATGSTKSQYEVTSPFPAKAFGDAFRGESFGSTNPQHTRRLDPVLHGEYTAIFLREPDIGRLRYGLMTRDAQGHLAVCDTVDVADAPGDAPARSAWSSDIGALPPWTEQVDIEEERKANKKHRFSHIALLDLDAVESLFAAAAELSSREGEIKGKLTR